MYWRERRFAWSAAALCLTLGALRSPHAAATDVRFDGSIGNHASQGPLNNGDIPGLAGEWRGGTLFHSFEAFSVTGKDKVTFQPYPNQSTANIVARVTGGHASQIDGTIASAAGKANVYLMNPGGIIFGSNASLDIKGSFFATTADSVTFGPKESFGAGVQQKLQGTFSLPPDGFGFDSKVAHGDITLTDSHLQGAASSTLGLIGGNVTLTRSTLDADHGEIQLASATSGTLGIGLSSKLTLPASARGGNITLTDSFVGDATSAEAGHGVGRIVIRGGTLAMDNSEFRVRAEQPGDGITGRLKGKLSVVESGILALVYGNFAKQTVLDFKARDASLSGGSTLLTTETHDAGRGGNLRLTLAGRLEMQDASISSSNGAADLGGDLAVQAGSADLRDASLLSSTAGSQPVRFLLQVKEALLLRDGSTLALTAGAGSMGIAAGSLTIRGASPFASSGISFVDFTPGQTGGVLKIDVRDRLTMLGGTVIASSTSGRAGRAVEISAGDVLLSAAGTAAVTGITGESDNPAGTRGGQITLNVARRLEVLAGATISSNSLGLGNGGRIAIKAGEVIVTGRPHTPGTFQDPRGITAQNQSDPGGPSGNIDLQAGSVLVLQGGEINASTLGTGRGGNISISGGEVTIRSGGRIVAESLDRARGAGGDVRLDLSGRLELRSGGLISVRTFGAGRGGDLSVRAGSVSIEGADATLSAGTQGSGRGGSITVDAGEAEVSDGGRLVAETVGRAMGSGGGIVLRISDRTQIGAGGSVSVSTLSAGAGGDLSVDTGTLSLVGAGAELAARSGGPGRPIGGAGGNVRVSAGTVEIADGGQITASTFGKAPGGDVTLEAARLSIHGTSDRLVAGISAQTLSPGLGGPGGRLMLNLGQVVLAGAGASISTSSAGGGPAGGILLHARDFTMADESTIQSSGAGSGASGSVEITAGREIALRSGSTISVAAAEASAGDILLRANRSIDLDQAAVTGAAALTGGSITLTTRDLLFLRDSRLSANATSSGGNINVDPTLIVLDHSLIDARAIFATGGNIQLTSDFYVTSPASLVNASSQKGIDGEVNINAFNIDLTGSLVELPARLLDAESMLRDLCTMKLENFSSFVRQGRGGLPPTPGRPLPSLEIVP